jgi:hypothetical protein
LQQLKDLNKPADQEQFSDDRAATSGELFTTVGRSNQQIPPLCCFLALKPTSTVRQHGHNSSIGRAECIEGVADAVETLI